MGKDSNVTSKKSFQNSQATFDDQTVDGRDSITSYVRDQFVQLIVHSLLPTRDPVSALDKRMRNLYAYAKEEEHEVFKNTSSPSEYYTFLAEKIYKIRKDFEEFRKNLQQSEHQQIRVPTAKQQGGTILSTTTTAKVYHVSNGDSSELQAPVSAVARTKEWHSVITSNMRDHLVFKLMQAISLTPGAPVMSDKRMDNLIAFSRQVEDETYKMSNSSSEYYHLLAKTINAFRRKSTNHQKVQQRS